MRITGFHVQRYNIGLHTPLAIGTEVVTHRHGLIVTLTDFDGAIGHGDICPLAGLHSESLDDAIGQLTKAKPAIMGHDSMNCISNLPAELYGCVRCGIEMAVMDLTARKSNSLSGSVSVCGLLFPGAHDILSESHRLAGEGYKVIKIKVGRGKLADDVKLIRSLREELGSSVRFRLDANRAWSLDEALHFCNEVGADRIEYIEEPIRDRREHGEFVRQSDIRLALDESLAEIERPEIADCANIGALILKPSVLGGMVKTSEWITFAKAHGIVPVLSCCFESGISIRAYARLALEMGIAGVSHGLDTLKFLREDVLTESPKVVNGRIESDILDSPAVLREDLLTEVTV